MNVNDSTPHFQGLSCVKTPLGLWDIDTPKSVVSQMNYRLNIICSMHLLNMYILIYLITYISYIYILIIYVHICTHALNVQKKYSTSPHGRIIRVFPGGVTSGPLPGSQEPAPRPVNSSSMSITRGDGGTDGFRFMKY